MNPISRNNPCPCGSGKKHKKCCLGKSQAFDKIPLPTNFPGRGFLYRQTYQCLKLALQAFDDIVAIKLGDVIVQLSNKSHDATLVIGWPEINNSNIFNARACANINLHFEGSTYLTLNYVSDSPENALTIGKDKFEVVLAYIELALGERAVYRKLYEQTVDLQKNALTHTSDVMLNPASLEPATIEDEQLHSASNRWAQLMAAPEAKQQRVAMALRWYQRGLLEETPDDRFLFFWICFEVLAMPDTTSLDTGIDNIISALTLEKNRDNVKAKFHLGEMFGYRNDIVHHGKRIFRTIFDDDIRLLKQIVSELLRAEIGIKSLRLLSNYL